MAAPLEANKQKASQTINQVFLYRAGQDSVQDIVLKAQDIFQAIKVTQLPNGTSPGHRSSLEKVNKLKEGLNQMEGLFKKLRVIYNECQKQSDVEADPQCLIPMIQPKDGEEQDKDAQTKSANKQLYENKKKEAENHLHAKNLQLQQLMCHMRTLVCDLNSALSCAEKPLSNI